MGEIPPTSLYRGANGGVVARLTEPTTETATTYRGPAVSRRLRRRLRTVLVAATLLVGIVAIGCSQGAYPLDIFYEMHYQQSYKSHEPPRLLGVAGAVPFETGQVPRSTLFNTGQYLFAVNCVICHGQKAKGYGPVLKMMMDNYGYTPVVTPDLTSAPVTAMAAGGIRGFMVSGVTVMPSFKKLLTPDEMQLIASYIVDCLQPAEGARASHCP